jgi:hypothetical protein
VVLRVLPRASPSMPFIKYPAYWIRPLRDGSGWAAYGAAGAASSYRPYGVRQHLMVERVHRAVAT